MRDTLRASRLVVSALLAASACGCSATMTVRHYPPFYNPAMKKVAVVPFANATLNPKAGEFLAERLAEAMKENGTYEVTGPKDLSAGMAAAKLKLAPGADVKTTAAALRKLGGVQAFLAGTVKGFSADRSSYMEVEDRYGSGFGWGYTPRGNYYGGRLLYRQRSYTHAYVAATAELVRVSDGKILHATPATLMVRLHSSDQPAKTKEEALVEAARAAAEKLVEEFAVVPRQIKVRKKDALSTARPRPGRMPKSTGKFRADAGEMYVLVRLPAAADRNALRLTITRKGDDKPLAEESFTWAASDGTRRFTFSPRKLAEAARGAGDFEAKLYLDDRAVLKRKFEIED